MAAPRRSDDPRGPLVLSPNVPIAEAAPVCMKCRKPMALDDPALCTGRPLRERVAPVSAAEAHAQYVQSRADEEARHLAYKQAYKAERVTRLRASYTRKREAAAVAAAALATPAVDPDPSV